METQDRKKPVSTPGHEVHLCHRCGWPFPNPHPSARHRRAHKRLCGNVEGYKISQQDLDLSDDEHGSDDDEHTPSPKVEKKNANMSGSGGGVFSMSNKSEDDVFSDAATEFSESGVSPVVETAKGVENNIEQASALTDTNTSQWKKATETTEQPNDPTNAGQVVINQSISIIPANEDSVKEVFVKFGNNFLQSDGIKSESQSNADVIVEENKPVAQSLDSEEGKTSGPGIMAVDSLSTAGNADNSDTINLSTVKDKPELEDDNVFLSKSGEEVESSVLIDRIVTSTDLNDRILVVSSDDVKVEGNNDLSGSENANVNEAEESWKGNEVNKEIRSFETVSDAADLQDLVESENVQTKMLLAEKSGDVKSSDQKTSEGVVTNLLAESDLLTEKTENDYGCTNDVTKISKPAAAETVIEPEHSAVLPETSRKVQETTPVGEKCLSEAEPPALDVQTLHDYSANDKGDYRLVKERDNISANGTSCGSSITESLEGKWGSISVAETNSLSSPKSETNKQTSVKKTGEEGLHGNSDEFEGRKKNEEVIAKVTSWSTGKEHHNQLKSLMDEAKSRPKQVPPSNQRDETSKKDIDSAATTLSSVLDSEAHKDHTFFKEEWNSPARYPAMIKKEKKKGKPFWLPFACCSSGNRDP